MNGGHVELAAANTLDTESVGIGLGGIYIYIYVVLLWIDKFAMGILLYAPTF